MLSTRLHKEIEVGPQEKTRDSRMALAEKGACGLYSQSRTRGEHGPKPRLHRAREAQPSRCSTLQPVCPPGEEGQGSSIKEGQRERQGPCARGRHGGGRCGCPWDTRQWVAGGQETHARHLCHSRSVVQAARSGPCRVTRQAGHPVRPHREPCLGGIHTAA